jgi:hypothetical protein
MALRVKEVAPGLWVREDSPDDVTIDREFVEEITRGRPDDYRRSVLHIAQSSRKRTIKRFPHGHRLLRHLGRFMGLIS